MAATVQPVGETEVPAMGLLTRIVGVVFSPRATYADVAARPRAAGVIGFAVLTGGLAVFTFLSTDVGKRLALDRQVQAVESFGGTISDEMYARLEQGVERAPYLGLVVQSMTLMLEVVVVAGLALIVFNGVLGHNRRFKHVFAVVAHTGVILVMMQAAGLALSYAREATSGTTTLLVFAPFLDDRSLAARVLDSVDLGVLWWSVSAAIGLGALYQKRTGPIAATLITLYLAFGIITAVIRSALA